MIDSEKYSFVPSKLGQLSKDVGGIRINVIDLKKHNVDFNRDAANVILEDKKKVEYK